MELKCPPKRLARRCPRRNLPSTVGRKRGESNFVLAFGRAYSSLMTSCASRARFCAGREVPVSGFGIADFIWVAWADGLGTAEGRAVAGKRLGTLSGIEIHAFEMKIRDWRRGVGQATRYRFFAHTSSLVLPPEQARAAFEERGLFRSAGVGLISFDFTDGRIRTLLRPRRSEPLSDRAHRLVLAQIAKITSVITAQEVIAPPRR